MRKKLFDTERSLLSQSPGNPIHIEKLSRTDIAIIGMAGKLPAAENLDEFWNNISNGLDCVIDFPQNRREEIKQYFNFKNIQFAAQDLRFKRKGFLSEIDKFDYKFFRHTHKEACLMNPAQRLFL